MTRNVRRSTVALVAIAAVTVALMAGAMPLSAAAHQSALGALGQAAFFAPFTLVGVIVAYRQPANPIGWIMLAIAPIYLLGADAGLYGVIAFRLGHPGLPLARLAVG